MKKALYIIFIIGILIITTYHVQMFFTEYKATTLTESKLTAATIHNSDGSYLMLFNPGESTSEEKRQSTQQSILITAQYNLRDARYIVLDGYYTNLDYTIKESDEGSITEVNLYNNRKQEKMTLEYNNAGSLYGDPQINTVPAEEIPTTALTKSPNREKKIALSKGNSYVEIPEYFEIEYDNYLYVPVDFVQFTNISSDIEKE